MVDHVDLGGDEEDGHQQAEKVSLSHAVGEGEGFANEAANFEISDGIGV